MKHQALIDAATAVRKQAHAPYSKYKVGAALQAADGRVFVGCNVENRSYGLTVCAERNAMAAAVAAGAREFTALAVVTQDEKPAAPCGACRQVLAELAPVLPILLASTRGNVVKTRLDKLLPMQFEFSPPR